MTDLHKAAFKGEYDKVVKLVEKGGFMSKPIPVDTIAAVGKSIPDLPMNDQVAKELGITPLMCAVMGGHLDVVNYLLGKGADANFKADPGANFKGGSPVNFTLRPRNPESGGSSRGSILDAEPGGPCIQCAFTPFTMTYVKYSKAIAEKLVKAGADPTVGYPHTMDHSLIINAVPYERRSKNSLFDYIEYLLELGSDYALHNNRGAGIFKALTKEVQSDDRFLPLLLKHNIPVPNHFLFDAGVYTLSFRFIAKMIEAGANSRYIEGKGSVVDIKGIYKDSLAKASVSDLFAIAVRQGMEDVILLAHACLWSNYEQPKKSFEFIDLLKKSSMGINASGYDGRTVLHLAVELKNKTIIQYLIDNGADPYAFEIHGRIPLEMPKVSAEAQSILGEILEKDMQLIAHDDERLAQEAEKETQRQEALEKQREAEERRQLNENLQKYLAMGPSGESTPREAFNTPAFSLEISHDELKLGEELGIGSFGKVYKGTWRFVDVAVKQLHYQGLSPESVSEFKAEANIMANLRHPNIIQLYGACYTQPYSIVMEYAPSTLAALIHSNQELDWSRRLTLALGIAKGLAYLHGNKPQILHRDLKSMNILIGTEGQPKLTDFGLARVKEHNAPHSTTQAAVGTLQWSAPEMFDDEYEGYGTACDIYSVGVVFWEIASRELPYKGKGQAQILAAVITGKRPAIPENTPVEFKNIIALCWKQDNKTRPSAPRLAEEMAALAKETQPASSGYLSMVK